MNKVESLIRCIKNTLKSKSMPVWLTLLTLITGVVITYLVAPHINKKFENDRIRTSYLLDNLKSLNSTTGDLISYVGAFNRQLIKNKQRTDGDTQRIEELITKLQWRVVEYDIIFGQTKYKYAIEQYQKSLESLRKSIVVSSNDKSVKIILCNARIFVKTSHEILKVLSQQADINLDTTPTFDSLSGEECDKQTS